MDVSLLTFWIHGLARRHLHALYVLALDGRRRERGKLIHVGDDLHLCASLYIIVEVGVGLGTILNGAEKMPAKSLHHERPRRPEWTRPPEEVGDM